MADTADTLGWHPFQSPSAVNSVPYDDRPACTYCGFCQYNGCYLDAKGATNVNVIRRAEETGLLRIETSAAVTRIESDGDGLATGVTYEQDGREHFQPARVVLVGTFIYENARLLLLSTSKAHPNGLSNNHGRVGKDYIAHIMAFAYGRFPGRRLNLFNGIGSQVTCVDDWNADNFDHAGLGFVSGGMLSAQHELAPIGFARSPLPPGVPRWGSGWKAWLARNAQSVGPTFGQFDALPYETNYVDLDPAVRDPRGLPVIRVTHRAEANERRGYRFMQERMQRWLRAAGAAEVWEYPTMFFEGRHCYGGTRMGDDPETSVVDGWGLSHEVPNLGMLGASTFPSAAGHNPTLTVQAQAWRTARRVVDAWGTIAR
jgi:gluconate 2-dehydrogenase alpha chain